MDDLKIDPTPIDPLSLAARRHYSVANYTRTALTDRVCFDGSKPICQPAGATDAMLDAAEARLGHRLPESLRAIYRLRDGASVGSLWVPKVPKPRAVFDDWEDAFANDYNDILPLADVRTLQAIYLENFDPEYDEDERQHWYPESDKLVVIANRGGRGTALDYRDGPQAGIWLFDLGLQGDARTRLKLPSFDAFLEALRREVQEKRPPFEATEEAPDATRPERFWCFDTYVSDHGVTPEVWAAEGDRLRVALPPELLPFYAAANGGNTRFLVAADSTVPADDGEPLGLMPGNWVHDAASLLPVQQWVSLAELSERLEFRGCRSWAELWPHADRLIVVAAAHEEALMLDYGGSEWPAVLCVRNLHHPETALRFASVAAFLATVRPVQQRSRELFEAIGDARLGVRAANFKTLWQTPGERPAATETLIAQTNKRLRIEIGSQLAALYAAQDGGAVRYRFHPPEKENAFRYRNEVLGAKTWVDFFPAGLQPMADWELLANWAKAQGLKIDATKLLEGSMVYSSDAKPRFVVLGALQTGEGWELTLLDVSQSYFQRQMSLMRTRWVQAQQVMEIVIGQKMLEHINRGVLQRLRALRA